jgi:hypothetical protein
MIRVVALRGHDQVLRELRIAIDRPNTLYYVSIIQCEFFIGNDYISGLERRAPRQLVVDDPVELIGGGVRQAKLANNLLLCISTLIPDPRNAWPPTSGIASSSVNADADGPDILAQRANSQSVWEQNGDQALAPRVC